MDRSRYDEHGRLNTVVNRNGDTVRSFSYTDGLMVTYSDATGPDLSLKVGYLGGQTPRGRSLDRQ
ncbi:hypothetical protein ACLUUA_19680 [Enterobacterales bacterium AN_CKDN230030167-1A_HGKHYDSX7]